MKALVTGGHGFIGSFLVERLLKEGFHVRCLVRKSSNLQWLKGLQQVELCYGDLTTPKSLPAACQGVEIIYHIAGTLTGANLDRYFSVNTQGTIDLLKATVQVAPNLKRFVFVSSVAAIGPSNHFQVSDETTPCQPVSIYGKSKLEAEKDLIQNFSHIPYTIIRPTIVYGPRDQHFLTFFKFAKRGIFPVPHPYERYYSIIHVSDLVDGIFQASQNERAVGQTYVMCNPEYYSFETMAQKLAAPFQNNPKFIPVPKFAIKLIGVAGDLHQWWTKKETMFNSQKLPEVTAAAWGYTPQKAMDELGFKIQTSLEEGARQTVAWYQKHKYL